MKSTVTRALGYVVLPIILLVTFQNCSQSGFVPSNVSFSSLDGNSQLSAGGCSFNGQALSNGQSVIAYLNSSESTLACRYETRTCLNGALSGSYNYASCSIGSAASACLFNGQTIAHGSSVTAYAQSSAAATGCASQTRSCDNGILSGSYSFAHCTTSQNASCLFNGQTIASGQTVVAYQSSSVNAGSSCQSQQRTCFNGSLSGNYSYGSCTVAQAASCLFDGKTVAHGQSITAYTTQHAGDTRCHSFAESRTCQNGSLSGSAPFASCNYNYYQWSYDGAVVGPCGGPKVSVCDANSVGQVIIGNYCGSGDDARWVCKKYAL